MKNNKKILKNKKGSVTIFVIVAIAFFLMIVIGVYLKTSNSKQAQLEQIEKITSEYNVTNNEIESEYNKLIEND